MHCVALRVCSPTVWVCNSQTILFLRCYCVEQKNGPRRDYTSATRVAFWLHLHVPYVRLKMFHAQPTTTWNGVLTFHNHRWVVHAFPFSQGGYGNGELCSIGPNINIHIIHNKEQMGAILSNDNEYFIITCSYNVAARANALQIFVTPVLLVYCCAVCHPRTAYTPHVVIDPALFSSISRHDRDSLLPN